MAPHATCDSDSVWYGAESSCPLPENIHEGSTQADDPSSTDHDLIEPIAIVGVSFQLPQDANSADSFWKILMEQRSTARNFPKDRLSASANYHPDPSRRGAVSNHC